MAAKQENVEGVQKPNHEAETISTDDDKIGLLEDFPLDQVMIGFILFYFCVCLFGGGRGVFHINLSIPFPTVRL